LFSEKALFTPDIPTADFIRPIEQICPDERKFDNKAKIACASSCGSMAHPFFLGGGF
jgi:hypothetical protein